jgi:molecular chaperone GrpE
MPEDDSIALSDNVHAEQNAAILQQFADWLRSKPLPAETQEPQVGLYQLFEALTAQRHELKLYTKSGRQTQELLADCIRETSAAVETLQRFYQEKPEVERKAVEPYLTSLCEIDEAIQRSETAMESLQRRLMGWMYSQIEHSTAIYCANLSWWMKTLNRKTIRHFSAYLISQQDEEVGKILEPFRTGITMLQRRMNDVLQKHSIRRLAPWGEPVDPETMQVVAVVESDKVPPGYVVDVVRFGYTWQGIPLRFADVCAAKTTV